MSIPNARLLYLAARFHSLGPRATYELLRELINGADLVPRLERYCLLDPAIVAALGADALPALAVLVRSQP